MIHVLFVCLGNICRSPMAEAMFRDLVKREGLENEIAVDSCGTGDWHTGNRPHHGTLTILKKYKINDKGLVARQIKLDDFEKFDYIVAMDSSNVVNIQRLKGNQDKERIVRLLDLVEEVTNKDVPDPYYSGNFEEVYELINQGCQALLAKIRLQNQL
ncbi:low molecular weight protein-tyrosine-phosphatase [Bacillus sp. 03113]|uniref:low molecular weight protein-tyrosine-phosphatase n=1 Tax=Bacillus sp. 03113 TaxID=2578211 RepID=UPI001141E334|nr:low molecular weight protein-tyrosine-phosphatase [Bacillus sp. 03113]